MQHSINGKAVDFTRAGDLLKPLDQWRVGDLKALEDLGVRFSTDGTIKFSITEAAALVYYLARKANPKVSMADIDTLSPEELGNIVLGLQEKMERGPRDESPLASGSGTPPTSSDVPSAGPSMT